MKAMSPEGLWAATLGPHAKLAPMNVGEFWRELRGIGALVAYMPAQQACDPAARRGIDLDWQQ